MTTTSIPHPASHFEPTAGSGAVPLGLPINSPSDKMVNAKIRILIADDHPVIREGLVEVLDYAGRKTRARRSVAKEA